MYVCMYVRGGIMNEIFKLKWESGKVNWKEEMRGEDKANRQGRWWRYLIHSRRRDEKRVN